MKKSCLFTLLLSSIMFGQIRIDYQFTENYPKFPNPPVKNSYLIIDENQSIFVIVDTAIVQKPIIYANEETSEIKTWHIKTQKENREYLMTKDSLFTKLKVKSTNEFALIQEKLPIIDWKFSNETKQILGYECQAAEAKIRGYNFKVFFTEKIPISNGPWILNGLPGAILLAENDEESVIIEAVEISNEGRASLIINNFIKRKDSYSKILRSEYINDYREALERERKYAKSKSSLDFIDIMKEKGFNVSVDESAFNKQPPPASIELGKIDEEKK